MSRTEEAYASTLAELRSESASALGRIGGILEATLQELRALRAEAVPAREREVNRERGKALLARARLYRYFLEVQREAVGLRDHRDLDTYYPPPDGRL
jgi:hypothetical protein